MLGGIFPEKEWLPWKFRHVPKGFWEVAVNRKKFIGWLFDTLKLKDLQDWYKVSLNQIQRLVPMTLFDEFSLADLLVQKNPEYPWLLHRIASKDGRSYKSAFKFLREIVHDIFPLLGRKNWS